jgi:FeS assembly protein IscX
VEQELRLGRALSCTWYLRDEARFERRSLADTILDLAVGNRIGILDRHATIANNSHGDLMAAELHWNDAEDIGLALSDAHPEQNPLELRFTDLHRMVTSLPTFSDDPSTSNEGKLEAIQMAWYEEWQDRKT